MKTNKKEVKIFMKIIAVLLVLVLIAGIVLSCYYLIRPAFGEVEIKTVGDGKTLTVGVLSDTQLPNKEPENGENKYKENTRKALEFMKEQNVDVVLFAGDFTDLASHYSYASYTEVFNDVFGEDKPETVYIMGNHDNWYPTDYQSVAPKERLYKECIGESPWVHKVINGFHFIGVSPDNTQNTNGYTKKTLEWMDEQIALAEKDTPQGNPIFVVTHHSPQNTVYGSDDWYDPGIDGVLSKYENVVSISGHSHYSMLDERSIYQNNYTAFQTQSMAYIELESGKFDAFKEGMSTIPQGDSLYPYAMIMRVGEDKTTIERWNVYDKTEEKSDNRWTLNYPLEKSNFTYEYYDRLHQTTPPSFDASVVKYDPAVKSLNDESVTLPGISFKAAEDDDLVQSYEINLKKSTGESYTYTVFSDFYLGKVHMSEEFGVALDKALEAGTYDVTVYAIDSFGHYSENCAKGTIELKK
ncbi:MAG: metallophosphoesterase family protein [Eubacterium sp.]